jgi:hypothetical protein
MKHRGGKGRQQLLSMLKSKPPTLYDTVVATLKKQALEQGKMAVRDDQIGVVDYEESDPRYINHPRDTLNAALTQGLLGRPKPKYHTSPAGMRNYRHTRTLTPSKKRFSVMYTPSLRAVKPRASPSRAFTLPRYAKSMW